MAGSFNFDSSGRIKKPTAEEVANADATTSILCLSRGNTADGKPYYAFVLVMPSRYAEFYTLSKQGKTLTIEDYGTIIACEFKAEPPPEVVQKMQKEYGFDENFVNNLENEFKKDQKQFLVKKEDTRIMDIVAMLKKLPPK